MFEVQLNYYLQINALSFKFSVDELSWKGTKLHTTAVAHYIKQCTWQICSGHEIFRHAETSVFIYLEFDNYFEFFFPNFNIGLNVLASF